MTTIFCVRPRGFNIGNDAIFLGVRFLLQQAFGAVNIVQVPAAPGDGGGFGGLTAATVHEMNQYGDGVVVGGGNLFENGGLAVDPQALSALRPPLLLLSLSHGRIYDRRHQLVPRTDAMPDAIVRALHDRACASVVRDDATLDYLRRLGIGDAVVGGCPTLLLDRLDLPEPLATVPDGTLLSIRHPQLMSVPPRDQARVYAAIPALIAALESDGLGPVRLLCHDLRDLPFASSLGAHDFILPDDVYGYLSLLRRARLVIAFRLHAFVPCLAFGTPVVHVAYDERSASLPRTLGLEAWNVDLVRDVDVVGTVRARCGDLARLATLRSAARSRWQALADVLGGAVADFAARVRREAGTGAVARQRGVAGR